MNKKIKPIIQKFLSRLGKNSIPLAIVVAGLIIAGALIFINKGSISEKVSGSLPPQEAAEKAINYINQNLLTEGMSASLVAVSEENGVYKFRLKIGEQEYDSYVTKNGNLLFTDGIYLEEKSAGSEGGAASQEEKTTCEEIEKTDSPYLEAFVVSNCPYGLQMQRVLDEVVKDIPSLAGNIKVEYIGAIQGDKITSMHGDEEAQENLRQICIREEQANRYWNYIGCFIKKGEVENCLASAGVNSENLTACIADSSRGLKYAKEDFSSQEKYKVTGSPTLILNGDIVSESGFGGRTAQSLKTLICCGFKTEPGICSQKLTEDSAAAGFSETYSQSSGSSGNSSCQ